MQLPCCPAPLCLLPARRACLLCVVRQVLLTPFYTRGTWEQGEVGCLAWGDGASLCTVVPCGAPRPPGQSVAVRVPDVCTWASHGC